MILPDEGADARPVDRLSNIERWTIQNPPVSSPRTCRVVPTATISPAPAQGRTVDVVEYRHLQGAVDAFVRELVEQECHGRAMHGLDMHGLAMRVGRRILERFEPRGQ